MHRVRGLLTRGAPALLAIALLGGVAPASDGDLVREGVVHWTTASKDYWYVAEYR